MIEANVRPLVTFALFAYNQERFIREAVAGAFAQTYSPLEIILSDDHSPDRTFAIIQEMAAQYTGPQKIVLNQNSKNLGVAGHVNTLMNMARGELIVFAAGDDISLPERTTGLTAKWLSSGRPSGLCSWVMVIDKNGKQIDSSPLWLLEMTKVLDKSALMNLPLWYVDGSPLLGCSAAWAKENWSFFGPLNLDIINEDNILTFRAALRGGLAVIPRPLVHYRQHDANIWNRVNSSVKAMITSHKHYMDHEQNRTKNAMRAVARFQSHLDDLHKAEVSGLIGANLANEIRVRFLHDRSQSKIRANWWNYTPIVKMLHWSDFYNDRLFVRLLSLLPLKPYAYLRFLMSRLRAIFN